MTNDSVNELLKLLARTAASGANGDATRGAQALHRGLTLFLTVPYSHSLTTIELFAEFLIKFRSDVEANMFASQRETNEALAGLFAKD